MIHELDSVALIVDLSAYQLKAGDVGTVVHVYSDGKACEIEFFALDGRTIDVVTVEAQRVRPISKRDMLHTRELSA